MKTMNKIFRFLFLIVISVSFSQCASTMKLQRKAPVNFGEVYTQNWIAGVKGGGSGTNIFIEITENTEIVLDSVYFKGKVSKLDVKSANNKVFIGRFLSNSNTKQKHFEEIKEANTLSTEFPFNLKDDECVVSYLQSNKRKYYKLDNIKERQVEALPMSAPPNKN